MDATDTAMDALVNSLSFEVEAIPQDNAVEINSTANMTPVNVKIRVRKKQDAGEQKGVIMIPKYGHSDNVNERIRLASSDQTIMSFNMLMEADLERKPLRKPKKYFFGGCIGVQYDDDNNPYMLNTADSTSSRSESVILKKNLKLSKNTNDTGASQAVDKKPKKFFGKCKPGGCLDPPFGEDKYAYRPKEYSVSPKKDNALVVINKDISTPSKVEEDSILAHKLKEEESVPSDKDVESDKPCEDQNNGMAKLRNKIDKPITRKGEDHDGNCLLNLYQMDSMKNSLEEKDSDSIITYPPALTYSGLNINDEWLEKNANNNRNSSASSRSRKSFNEHSAIYFTPRDTSISSKDRDKRDSEKERHVKPVKIRSKIPLKTSQDNIEDKPNKLLENKYQRNSLLMINERIPTVIDSNANNADQGSNSRLTGCDDASYEPVKLRNEIPMKNSQDNIVDEAKKISENLFSDNFLYQRNSSIMTDERIPTFIDDQGSSSRQTSYDDASYEPKKLYVKSSQDRQSSAILKKFPYNARDGSDIRDEDALNRSRLSQARELTIFDNSPEPRKETDQVNENNIEVNNTVPSDSNKFIDESKIAENKLSPESAYTSTEIPKNKSSDKDISLLYGNNDLPRKETKDAYSNRVVSDIIQSFEEFATPKENRHTSLNVENGASNENNINTILDHLIDRHDMLASSSTDIESSEKSTNAKSGINEELSTTAKPIARQGASIESYDTDISDVNKTSPIKQDLGSEETDFDKKKNNGSFSEILPKSASIHSRSPTESKSLNEELDFYRDDGMNSPTDLKLRLGKTDLQPYNLTNIDQNMKLENDPQYEGNDENTYLIPTEIFPDEQKIKKYSGQLESELKRDKSISQMSKENQDIYSDAKILEQQADKHPYTSSLKCSKNSTPSRLNASPIPSVILDLAIQSYTNDNDEKVVKTLDTVYAKQHPSDNVIVVQSLKSNGQAIRIPIDADNDMTIQFKKALPDQHDRNHLKPKLLHDDSQFDSVKSVAFSASESAELSQPEPAVKHHKVMADEILHNVLASIYEQELVPLQKVIKSLKEEIDTLAGQQKLFRDRLLGTRIRPMRLVHSNKRCGCLRK